VQLPYWFLSCGGESEFGRPLNEESLFSTRAISGQAREALYVLDGLLENDTILG
jgi:hypothetical protein